jgi:hypothetical protein
VRQPQLPLSYACESGGCGHRTPKRFASRCRITNGESTLVAWTNGFANPIASHIFMRLLDSPLDRNAISLGSGFAPHIATNGCDYLVGWSARGTRFTFFRSDNAVVHVVSAEGVPAARKVLNHSVVGGVTDIAWTGTHWMVAYYLGQDVEILSRVVLLDESLNITATVETGKGHVRALRRASMVGGGHSAPT